MIHPEHRPPHVPHPHSMKKLGKAQDRKGIRLAPGQHRRISKDQGQAFCRDPFSLRRQDPHRQLERSEVGRALERGLRALPEQQRQILVLRELSGLSYQEIAEKLNLDLGTVKSRIARARLALRKILSADGNFFSPPPSNPAKKEPRR